MHTFKFEIEINSFGRPVIVPAEEGSIDINSIECKFMAIELIRAMYHSMSVSVNENPNISDDIQRRIESTYINIEKLSNVMAHAINEQIKGSDRTRFDVEVDNKTELFELNYNGFIYGDRIYSREVGLRVKVKEEEKVYELIDGIDNEHWKPVKDESEQ